MSVRMYIGNLPRKLTRDKLLSHFESVRDEILKIDLGLDREGRFKGYCYLFVSDATIANDIAKSFNNSMFSNKHIRVTQSLQRHHHHDAAMEELATA